MKNKKDYFKKEEIQYLTVKERKALRILLKNSRTTNVSLGKRLKITPQSAGRIRRKLKSAGIMKSYEIKLDYYQIGIKAFALVLFDIEHSHEDKIFSQNLIGLYKILTNTASHIALYGFRNMNELNNYFNNSEINHSKYIKIVNMYSFSPDGWQKHSSKDLFTEVLKKFGKKICNLPKEIPQYYNKNIGKQRRPHLDLVERKILQEFIKDSRISSRRMCSKFENSHLTGKEVSRIKRRLENKRIIRGYTIKLDYKNLGINVIAFILISKKPNYWESQRSLEAWAYKCPHVIGCYKLHTDNMHVLFCGFKDLLELEEYCHDLQKQNKNTIKIKNTHVTSPKGIIKDSSSDLFLSALDYQIYRIN